MVYFIYIRSGNFFQIFTKSIVDAIDVTRVTLSRYSIKNPKNIPENLEKLSPKIGFPEVKSLFPTMVHLSLNHIGVFVWL